MQDMGFSLKVMCLLFGTYIILSTIFAYGMYVLNDICKELLERYKVIKNDRRNFK